MTEYPKVDTIHYPVLIVGGGQAGLAMSYCLKQQGIDHAIIEKAHCAAHSWKSQRWDAFCLVTPNWQCQLPGHPYEGNDPDGFMVKAEIIDYLDNYYKKVNPKIYFDQTVESLDKKDGLFYLTTTGGHYSAEQVVLACGSYHRANILPFAKGMPEQINHVHSSDYKNPEQLPPGEVMVIGTGQSGTQIAEDLHLAGRKVHLSVGAAPRVNRRYRGKDVVKWLEEMGYYETTIDTHPDGKNAPHSTNHYVTGRDGGRDLNLRIFAEQGMQLYGHLKATDNGVVEFADDLKANLDYADEVAARIIQSIEGYIQKHEIEAPEDTNIYSDYLPPSPPKLDLNKSGITSVVWATGFKTQFSWVKPAVFEAGGAPSHKRGITREQGLYFLGLNWMHTWGSGRFYHVGKDAQFLARQIDQLYQCANKTPMSA
ncbi:MAG TPA: MSMEG_0569 family flavin-dependent oxidoreductase [Marinagarivorans sp.]